MTDVFGKTDVFELNLTEAFPALISGFGFKPGMDDITITWVPVEDIKGYNIYRSDTETGDFDRINDFIVFGTSMYYDLEVEELSDYYFKVSVVSNTGNELNIEELTAYQAWTSLVYHPDWLPITVVNENHGKFWGAPNVYDMENDGEEEIFITSGKGDQPADIGSLFGFRHNGEELYDIDNDPITVSGFANIGISMTCTPAIGDIDNDGITEVVVATRMGENENDPEKYRLYVYKNIDANGDDKPDLWWNKQIHYKNFNGVVLSDLDENGTLEIIVPNQWGNKIEVFDYLGNDYPGWPKTTGENPADKKAVSMPVVVDLDDDGDKEIIIGLEGGIYIWNSNGSNYLGQNPIDIPVGGRFDCPVIAADIDNDYNFEILFMAIQNKTGYIYALEADGSLVTGWDNDDHNIELSIQSQEWAWPSAFVCGDIDLDGYLEVIIADASTLKVWDYLGTPTPLLDKNIPTLQCRYLQPLIANVDGTDDECEIIIPSNDGVIYAFKLNGDPVLGWPLYLGSTTSIPLIGDIDNDLKNEIIAASSSDIYVWDSEGNANKNQWDRFRLNPYNNAVFYNACFYNPTPLVINSNETWNIDKTINRDLVVENGTLTIKSIVRFSSSTKIIIKPGAELVLDGGKLINGCDNSWQGIQVWGNRDESQYCPSGQTCAQGKLTLKNGAVIENAVIAVDLWNPDHLGTTGGMVFATDAVFRNNAKSVHALQYRNFHPYYPEVEWDYFSNFENCTFEITSGYPGDVIFYKHVDLSHVRGIDFQACDFSLIENVAGVSE